MLLARLAAVAGLGALFIGVPTIAYSVTGSGVVAAIAVAIGLATFSAGAAPKGEQR